ncbi:MAG TPA: mycothiol conjugate amidase Mca [Acidimicrobiaceae bacterium]|nr:mycothiol conjugate amidase Mca [Acidimicrobiaceae bacterium]
MAEPLSILAVHAHPDDEASKGPGTIRRYADEGVRTTLVCCTGGEEGDILNPSMDRPDVVDNLGEVRRMELAAAAAVIGYDEVVMLGYRDSGMVDTDANSNPAAFANADLDEAVGRLVEVIRRVRPQVVLTYSLVQEHYPHPDHLQVTAISMPAFANAGDPDWKPHLGPAFEPVKLYTPVWSHERLVATHQAFLDHGLESPFDEKWLSSFDRDQRITARLLVDNAVRRKGLLAHATQVDPDSPFWFGLPDDVSDAIHPYEEYELIESRIPTEPLEDDLFAGLRGVSPAQHA